MASRNLGLRKSIAPMLESIDSIFSEKGKPLHIRPFEAASLIARHSIVSVEGDDDKDNFVAKPWFAALYAEIHNWYKHKYGSLFQVKGARATGLVVYRGIPHVVEIPLTISTLQEDGLVKLTFPTRVYETEDPNQWIRPTLTKRAISAGGVKLARRINVTCSAIRQLQINIGTAGGKDTGVPRMAASIVDHLSKAATAASADHQESNSLALWDIHLACEKAVKSLLSQRNISYPKTHDLAKLTSLLSDISLEGAAHRIIHRLPSDSLVMRHRYLQEPPISPNRLYVLYSLALNLCLIFTSRIDQRFRIGDASFFLKRPPWFSQLE